MGEFLVLRESYCVKHAAKMRTKDEVLSRLEEKWEISLKKVRTGQLWGLADSVRMERGCSWRFSLLCFGPDLAPLILVALSGNTVLGFCKESPNQRISQDERDAYEYIASNSLRLRIFILGKKQLLYLQNVRTDSRLWYWTARLWGLAEQSGVETSHLLQSSV